MENHINVLEKEYYSEHICFWGEFIKDREELERFIYEKTENENKTPKRMINIVQRLFSLSDEMDKIRPGRKALNITFIIPCIEGIFVLAGKQIQKQQMIIDFYDHYVDEEDKNLIQNEIEVYKDIDGVYFLEKITIEQFALLLISIRNDVMHEGVYWDFSFKDEEKGVKMMNIIKSKYKKDQGFGEITYVVGLTYSQFRRITIKGLMNFINNYFEQNCRR